MDAMTGRVSVMIGALMLAVGVFMPILSVPARGSVDMFDLPLPGIGLLVLAGAALILAALDLSRWAILPALGSLVALGIGYVLVQKQVEEARAYRLDLLHPRKSLEGLAARASDLQFGWALLGIGALLVLAGGIMAWRAWSVAGRSVAAGAEVGQAEGAWPVRDKGAWPAVDRTPLVPPRSPSSPSEDA